MSDQETQRHCVAGDDDHQHHSSATAEINNHHHQQGTLKRRSPPPPSSSSDDDQDQELEPTPRKKKPNFTRLNLPLTTPIQPSKFSLHRTLSAPPLLSPENICATSTSSPSPPTAIRRSVSDIASPAYRQVLTTIAPPPPPPPPPPTTVYSDSSIKRKTPNFKKMKKLEEMTKEISLWCEEAIRQMENLDEEEEEEEDPKKVEENDVVTEMEEAVSVDRAGDCLTIHFECPCGKGYQILLNGKNCYYKLVQY